MESNGTEIHIDMSPLGKFKGTPNPHYELWKDTETIDIAYACLTPEEFRGFLKGNILKYKLRAGNKEGQPAEKDLAKARHYQTLLRDLE